MKQPKYKVGDTVCIYQKSEPGEWTDVWTRSMDYYIGKSGVVTNIRLQGDIYAYTIDVDGYYEYPETSLALRGRDQGIDYSELPVDTVQEYNKRKADKGKLLFSLLTRGLALPIRAVAAVLTYGAQKYEPESWKCVPDAARRYEDALDRHLNAWKAGESFDEESGLHHMAHIACNALFLMWFIMHEKVNQGVDFFAYKEVKKHEG